MSAIALPAGRSDPPGQQETGSRVIRVYNQDAEDVPSFGAMEISGWDAARDAFTVRRCTLTGRNDLIFNGPVPIPSGLEGQARADEHAGAAYRPGEGRKPLPGEVWGVKAGSWLLAPNYPGYLIVDTTAASRNFCVARSQRHNVTEFVRVTGTRSPNAPADFVAAELVVFDPTTDAWGTTGPTTQVWYRDLNGNVGYYSATGGQCYAHVNLTGYASGRPVYVGRGDCSTTTTTTTTTTRSPCSGSCVWDYNFATNAW